MKTIFLICSLIFAFSCKKETQKNPENTPTSKNSTIKKDTASLVVKDESQEIENIKKEYAALNDLLETKKLNKISFDYDCNDERSGRIIYYSDKKGEMKIIEHFYAEYSHFSSVERYYISNGNVFFIFKEETEWSFDGGTPEKPLTRDDISEKRIYLQNNQPIKCLEKQYTIKSDSKNNPDPDKIPNKEMKCSTDELMKTYQSLIKNKEKRGKIKCL